MNKTYILQIESPEYPKGTQAVFSEENLTSSRYHPDYYALFFPEVNTYGYQHSFGTIRKILVDNRPDVWKLQEEKLEFTTPTEEVENEFRAFFPKIGRDYYWVNGIVISKEIYNDTFSHKNVVRQGAYRTARAAEMEAKRRESRAKAWIPEDGEVYYFVGLRSGNIETGLYKESRSHNLIEFLQGNCHKDAPSAYKWKNDGYWEAFNCLF